MVVADLISSRNLSPLADAGASDDGPDEIGPVKTLARTYLDPEGDRVRVVTEWWAGSAPAGMESDPDPDMPGHVVTQFCYRFTDGEFFRPMVPSSFSLPSAS